MAHSEKRTYTLGHMVLALTVLLGLLGGVLTLTDRFAPAASLVDLTARVNRIEDKLDRLIERLGVRPGPWEGR